MNFGMFENWIRFSSNPTSEGTSFQDDGKFQEVSKKSWDQGVNNLQNSRHDSNLNTIQSWLSRFGKPEILLKLENSLEQVKRNKIGQKNHEKLSKSIDRELQKLSLTFHPDRTGDTESQAALNAIREVLKTLTEVFLENIFIDYKYEYFSTLDVRVLVNENEGNKTIQTIFNKITVFSETKRLNIIGEIRKFLTESEKCVESFLKNRESDFLKFRDYALYHLRRNIEGYKKLERQCNLLIQECSNEDDCIRTVVQNMVDHSSREYSILRELEQSAKNSFQGNFEIFPVQKDMDEYYILPFVDYVNVLSMCNLLLQPPKSRLFSFLSKVENFDTGDEREYFLRAYILAYDIYPYKIDKKKETQSIQQELRKTLETIFRKVLQTDYSVDVYREDKSRSTVLPTLEDSLEQNESVIPNATGFVDTEKKYMSDSVEEFDKKWLIGLWWDAKGFWNVSDKEAVSDCMKDYNELNKDILRCIELAANDDENAYLEIIDLYKKIGDFKKTADEQAKGQSKALCEVAKNFLDKHMILNHHLKKVEFVVLGTDVKKLKKTVTELKENANGGIKNFERVLKKNQELEDSVENLKIDNQGLKEQMAKLEKDNADFKKFISDRFPGEF